MGMFSKLTDSLSKTRKGFVEKIFDAFTGKEIDDDLYDELEELLIQGDVGVNTAVDLVERLRERGICVYAAHLQGKIYNKGVLGHDIALLIGNEARGLSKETADKADKWIRIPMQGKIESLNAAVAAAILMYEAGF